MASIRYRSIDEIKETLQNARSRERGCTLLIGAGCSFTAGIPTATGFVDIIREYDKLAYGRALEKTYPKCMGELLLSERRDLIARYVDKAQINWEHICIALLMQGGYVDRVLTTNFDLLVVKACAVLGVFPAIYDFATSQLLKTADIPRQAVFYLHGQRTGFVLMNTDEDMEKHSELLGPVFEDAGRGRVWIVVGYSGENDPVFGHLASVPRFDNGLFWIGHGDSEPASHVREKLLGQDKDAFFTKGFDARSFFITLTRALGIFPPDLVARPFTYLDHALAQIAPFTDPGRTSETAEGDVLSKPRIWIQNAIAQFEGTGAPGFLAAQYLLMAGRYEQVLTFRKDYDESPSPELANVLSAAYVMQGNQLLDRAKAKTGEEADQLFTAAIERYQAALGIRKDMPEALCQWGNVLLDRAKTRTGQEADQLFMGAQEKYRAALTIKPDMYGALNSWGNLLLDLAKTKTGKEADQLFTAAQEKYQDALAIKPDYGALNNWGNLLLDLAKMKTGEEADQLFTAAQKKYQAALELKPDMYGALNNWGNLLLDLAKTKTGQEADQLFAAAQKKYQAALAIKPDIPESYCQWGNVLLDWAKTKTGEEADQLFAAAMLRYQAALGIKKDMPEALCQWGNVLLDRAKTKTGEEADQLFIAAQEKYQAALAIKADMYGALNNWANLLLDQGKTKTGQEADQLFTAAHEKYSAAFDIKPGTPDVLHNWGNLLLDWGKTKTGEESGQRLAKARERYEAARTIKPGTRRGVAQLFGAADRLTAPSPGTLSWWAAQKGDIVEFGYGSGAESPQYAALHTESGYFRIISGSRSGWGTSVVLLPSFWSGGHYYQGGRTTARWSSEGANLAISFSAILLGLSIRGLIRLEPPHSDSVSATVAVQLDGSVELDPRPGEAFKPVLLSSMHVAPDIWDSQSAFVDSQSFGIPEEGWIIPIPVAATAFGLTGGTSSWKTNAPTIDLAMDQSFQITGWVTRSSNSNDDNVAIWAASNQILRAWQYRLRAARP